MAYTGCRAKQGGAASATGEFHRGNQGTFTTFTQNLAAIGSQTK
jgi:hypothetical protein